jgi:hypothetical protein
MRKSFLVFAVIYSVSAMFIIPTAVKNSNNKQSDAAKPPSQSPKGPTANADFSSAEHGASSGLMKKRPRPYPPLAAGEVIPCARRIFWCCRI